MMRSSALSLALGYVALGIAALVLFAAPLYYAWQVTIQDGRSEILQADALRLTEVYRREGGVGLTNFIDARINMQIAGDRILLLTDASLKPLAGNLAAWPHGLPAAAGNYRIKVDLAEHGIQTSLVHVTQLGEYVLLVGRDNKLFAPLERRFWYGLIAAVAVISIAGLLIGLITRRVLMARVHSMRQTVSAIIHGDLKHRLPTDRSEDELSTLSSTINGMLDQIEQLINGIRDVSNSIAHDLRTPLAELRSRLEELSLTRPTNEETFAEIDGAVADVDRVIRIFNALLRLAEIESARRREEAERAGAEAAARREAEASARATAAAAEAASRRRLVSAGMSLAPCRLCAAQAASLQDPAAPGLPADRCVNARTGIGEGSAPSGLAELAGRAVQRARRPAPDQLWPSGATRSWPSPRL